MWRQCPAVPVFRRRVILQPAVREDKWPNALSMGDSRDSSNSLLLALAQASATLSTRPSLGLTHGSGDPMRHDILSSQPVLNGLPRLMPNKTQWSYASESRKTRTMDTAFSHSCFLSIPHGQAKLQLLQLSFQHWYQCRLRLLADHSGDGSRFVPSCHTMRPERLLLCTSYNQVKVSFIFHIRSFFTASL